MECCRRPSRSVEHIFELGRAQPRPSRSLRQSNLSWQWQHFWSSSHCFRRYQLDRFRATLREYAPLWARGNQREYNLDHSIRHQDQAHYERGHEWGFGPSFRVYLAAPAQLWYCQFKRGDRRNIWNYQTKSLFTNSGRFDWSQGRRKSSDAPICTNWRDFYRVKPVSTLKV